MCSVSLYLIVAYHHIKLYDNLNFMKQYLFFFGVCWFFIKVLVAILKSAFVTRIKYGFIVWRCSIRYDNIKYSIKAISKLHDDFSGV